MRRMLLATIALLVAAPAANAANNAAPGTPASGRFDVRVVSSAPDQVTGGDARLHISVPQTVPVHQVEVWVNGVSQRDRFTQMPGTRTLTGVIDGLVVGENTVQVNANGKGKGRPDAVQMTLENHPITGPVFSGPHQYPFVCNTVGQGLGEPIADDPVTGTKVFDAGNVVGYSRNCSAETRVDFRYLNTAGQWVAHTPGVMPPDAALITGANGATVPLVVRWERGTINRFLYSMVTPVPYDAGPWDLETDVWNRAVIFRFDGGVAIGHTQGSMSGGGMLYTDGLRRGYSVLYSSGTRTNTHYNLQLGGETALMVKERFIERYDVPRYTVGVGGSGGAIQQYVYAQNHPGPARRRHPAVLVPRHGHADHPRRRLRTAGALHGRDRRRQSEVGARGPTASLARGAGGQQHCAEPVPRRCAGHDRVHQRLAWADAARPEPALRSPSRTSRTSAAVGDGGHEWTHWADLVNIFGASTDGRRRLRPQLLGQRRRPVRPACRAPAARSRPRSS